MAWRKSGDMHPLVPHHHDLHTLIHHDARSWPSGLGLIYLFTSSRASSQRTPPHHCTRCPGATRIHSLAALIGRVFLDTSHV